jgi:hypothetical protein
MVTPRTKKGAAQAKLTKPAPIALAERAKALHAAKQARLSRVARDAIARIRERQVDIAANMVDIGLALAELKAPGVPESIGRAGFGDVCAQELNMAVSTANALVALATRVPREIVTRFGPDRARALLELVDATPADDTPEAMLTTKLALPSGRTLDVAAASARALRDAAREFRDAHPEARTRGFTASAKEKRRFAAVMRALNGAGESSGRLIASRDEAGAKVRFEVRLSALEAFASALRKAAKG